MKQEAILIVLSVFFALFGLWVFLTGGGFLFLLIGSINTIILIFLKIKYKNSENGEVE